jgi:hypothetical protein
MMPARYVKPYVQRGKSDALDAAAICEAVSRPTMRFAAIKSVEQQSALTLHRARERLRPSRWWKNGLAKRWPLVRRPLVEVLPDRRRLAAV